MSTVFVGLRVYCLLIYWGVYWSTTVVYCSTDPLVLWSTGPLVYSSTDLLVYSSTDLTFCYILSIASRDVSVTCREHDSSEALPLTALLTYDRGQPSLCRGGLSAMLSPISRIKTRCFGTVLSRQQTTHSVLACSLFCFYPKI